MSVFENEKAFEVHIRNVIRLNVLPVYKDLILFDSKKSVDVLLCRNGKNCGLYFLEIKYHKKSHGRLSTGHGKGGGFQPEMLSKQPDYFESNMRWILGIEDRSGFYFLKNSEMAGYVSGGKIEPKYNNIQTKLFSHEKGYDERELILLLLDWLK